MGIRSAAKSALLLFHEAESDQEYEARLAREYERGITGGLTSQQLHEFHLTVAAESPRVTVAHASR